MTYVSQYYGRGGARLCISRPRIAPEARMAYPALALRSLQVVPPVRLLALLIVILAMTLLSNWVFNHFQRSHVQNRKKVTPQPLKLVMQYQTAPREKPLPPQPQKIEKIKPMLPPLQPATEQPKSPPKKVVRKKTKPAKIEKADVTPKPAPKPKPVVKKRIDLEDSLRMEKKFDFPAPDAGARTAARMTAPPASSSLSVDHKMPDSIVDMQTIAPDRNRRKNMPAEVQEKLNHLEESLAMDTSAKPYEKIETASEKEDYAPLARSRQTTFNREEEIVVNVKEGNIYDYSDVQPDQSAPAPDHSAALHSTPTEEDATRSSASFAENGVSLVQLKACGPTEKTIKIKLAELVKEKGYPKQCADNSGIYKFFWPAERFTVQHFNVIIYTSQGRIATDRCEELTNACDCLIYK